MTSNPSTTTHAKSPAPGKTEAIRSTLEAERNSAVAGLGNLEGQLEEMRSAMVTSNGDEEHDPEGSTVAFEAAQLEGLRERVDQHVAEIDQAVQRLDADTYGICERCERPIGAARLDALPAAALCVQCADLTP